MRAWPHQLNEFGNCLIGIEFHTAEQTVSLCYLKLALIILVNQWIDFPCLFTSTTFFIFVTFSWLCITRHFDQITRRLILDEHSQIPNFYFNFSILLFRWRGNCLSRRDLRPNIYWRSTENYSICYENQKKKTFF